VHTTSAFEFRAETDCGRQLDNGWLVFNFLAFAMAASMPSKSWSPSFTHCV
jgi:hypothetical protein